MRESEFIEWIRSQSHFDPDIVPVGPGDDCAVITFGTERLIVTTDQVLDGVHFRLADHGPQAAGRKGMARNLSDVAAMAAAPFGAVATVALSRGDSLDQAQAIYRGLRSAGDEFNCPVVGGDVAVWDSPLAITVTVFARPDGIEPVLRSGAEAGDAICLTGAVGGAWRTRRHLQFTPRVREARVLADQYHLHAMIDVSDGLAADLGHICTASGVGAQLWGNAVPIHPDAERQGGEDQPGLAAALGDGEDYELLFTLSADEAQSLLKRRAVDVSITHIGVITEGAGMMLICPDGTSRPLAPTGWEHQT